MSTFHKVDGIGAVRCVPSSAVLAFLTCANFPLQAHGTELADVFGGGPMGDYLIRFAATLNPNGDGPFEWPRYTKSTPLLLTFNDAQPAFTLTHDTYRGEQMAYLTKLSLADPM